METRRRAVLLDNVTASKCRTTPSAKDMAAEASKHSEYAHRRRPRRPPFLRVESEGVGVTSSIRPIFMPERARARRADWAPGPGVLVELPEKSLSILEPPQNHALGGIHTTSSPDLDVEGSDAELLAADGDVLGSQHSGVGGGLVTVGLDLHATGDTVDGLTATGITQVSLCTIFLFLHQIAKCSRIAKFGGWWRFRRTKDR